MAALALEYRVFAHPHLDVQIPGGTAVASRLAFAVDANTIACIDAGGDGHRQGLLLPQPALAEAGVAGIADDFAAAFAARARLLNGENRLLHPHLTLPMAGVAGLGR